MCVYLKKKRLVERGATKVSIQIIINGFAMKTKSFSIVNKYFILSVYLL